MDFWGRIWFSNKDPLNNSVLNKYFFFLMWHSLWQLDWGSRVKGIQILACLSCFSSLTMQNGLDHVLITARREVEMVSSRHIPSLWDVTEKFQTLPTTSHQSRSHIELRQGGGWDTILVPGGQETQKKIKGLVMLEKGRMDFGEQLTFCSTWLYKMGKDIFDFF